MKFTLHLAPVNGGPFNCAPARTVEIEDDRIVATGSDCSLDYPGSRNGAGNLYVIGNEYGALGAVCARHEADAFDELVDRDLAASLLVTPEPTHEEADENNYTALGNAGKYADLTNAWIQPVSFEPVRDIELIVALAKAEGAGASFLSEV